MTRRSDAAIYADDQRAIIRRLGLDDETLLDAPFIYRADVVPCHGQFADPPVDAIGWQWRCTCSRVGWHTDPEVARSAAIEHVATHQHHEAVVRVFGRDRL